MRIRALLPAGLCSAILCAGLLGCGDRDPRPDVLLVSIDTLRADHLHTYGFPLETSPRIDAFASTGVVFERAVAAGAYTVPSHASMLSSRFVREHSIGYINGSTQLVGGETVAERFASADYATGAFVSNAVLRSRTRLDRGFDVYDDTLPKPEGGRPLIYERVAEDTTTAALAWLQGTQRRPVFLWVHYEDPHGPYAPPAGHAGRFKIPPAPGETPLSVRKRDSGRKGIPRYQVLPGLFLPSQYRSLYADEIFYADEWIGGLIAAFDERRARPGVVLLTADHGEGFGEQEFWFVHGYTTTPEVAHVPFILRAPGIAPGRRHELVSHVDVMPTLLELAGLDPPAAASGIALGPILRGEADLPERRVYCDVGFELGVYDASGFQRIPGVGEAWSGSRDDSFTAPESARLYAWEDDGTWAPTGEVAPIPPAVRRYASEPVPMTQAEPLGEEQRRRLRALGYLEDK